MYIYNGKLNFYQWAVNECITIVFPAGFVLGDPVCIYWQWTVTAGGLPKFNAAHETTIIGVSNTPQGYEIWFPLPGSYRFVGVIGPNFKTMKVLMSGINDPTQSVLLTVALKFSDPAQLLTTVVYSGKMDWYTFAVNEMVTLILPSGLADGAPVCLAYQWTMDSAGRAKENNIVVTKLQRSNGTQPASGAWVFSDGYDNFEITTGNAKGQDVQLKVNSPRATIDALCALKQTDFRQAGTKKALIYRFDTGHRGDGIFKIQEMLTDFLGFATEDIEILYFDVDPENSYPKLATKGQKPPTAANFRSSFQNLLSSAKAGDVRFVYVDCHGAPMDDDDGDEPDGKDELWIMAGNDTGMLKVAVKDDEVASMITAGLKPGVNLTIVTSSCFGGGMLDTHRGVGGILLSGCHETQFNVKLKPLNYLDPWTFALYMTLKDIVTKKKGAIPTYSTLYSEAKLYISTLIQEKPINVIQGKYRGPSPDERKPIPRYETESSNQDPQMAFYNGYIDPDMTRFCCPFVAPTSTAVTGDTIIYPKDQFPLIDDI